MNKVEKFVYDRVKSNPELKNKIRNIYQSAFDILPDPKDMFLNTPMVKEGYYFGFHDLSPFSKDGKFILSNKLLIDLHMPVDGDRLGVGYWTDDLDHYYEIGETLAWNYHKGCRLQWAGNSSTKIVYNDYEKYHLVARIYDSTINKTCTIDYPIDTVSQDGLVATSFSYERLNRFMPGYGYLYSDEPFFDDLASDKTGMFIINILNNERKLIVSLRQLSKIKPDETMKGATHYVTHSQFSPDGKRIAFLHRWGFLDDPDKRYTRLVTCKLDGSDIWVSCTSGMVSHFDWDEKHGIIAYAQVNGGDGHYLFPDYKMQTAKRVGDSLNSDGHQSFIPGTDCFVTDTYPDKRRRAKIYKVNIANNSVEKIVDVKSPKEFQSPDPYHHWACDLHPRVSPDGKYISFDSVHTGKRAFCLIKL